MDYSSLNLLKLSLQLLSAVAAISMCASQTALLGPVQREMLSASYLGQGNVIQAVNTDKEKSSISFVMAM